MDQRRVLDSSPPKPMSVLAWNCHGLGKPRTIRFLKEITQRKSPTLYYFSETLVKENKIREVCKALRFAEYYCVDVHGQSGGLDLL